MPEAPPPPLDGQAAFEAIRAHLRAVETDTERLLPFSLARLLAGLDAEWQQLWDRQEALTAHMHTDARAAFIALLLLARQVSHAGAFIDAQHERQVLAPSALRGLVDEATPLRTSGFLALDLLVALRLISADTAHAIRAGRGFFDLAGDLQTLGPLLLDHWTTLEPLQTLQADPDLRLTLPRIQRMAPLGLELLKALKDRKPTPDGTDWHAELIRCQLLLHDQWDTLRFTAVGGHAQSDELDRARAGYPSLRALHRRA